MNWGSIPEAPNPFNPIIEFIMTCLYLAFLYVCIIVIPALIIYELVEKWSEKE